MRYVIAPMEETTWRLPAPQLATLLEDQWPAASIRLRDHPWSHHVLEWHLPLAQRALAGALDHTGQVVVLEGDVRACATFAQWLRAQVPDTYRLRFYDERYTATIELRQAMTAAEVVGPFVL